MVMMTPVPAAPARQADARFARAGRLCFVIGAQKAGTNWVHNYLKGHPDASVPLLKETGYWSTVRPPHRRGDRLKKALKAQADKGPFGRAAARLLRGRYLETLAMASRFAQGDQHGSHSAYADVLFQDWRGEPAVCEADPQNALLGRETFSEMAALNADVRFVFLMRDPLSRLISGMRHSLLNRHGAKGVTSAALEAELRAALDQGGETLAFRRSRYDLTLDELDAAVAPERLHLFFYETFFTAPEFDRFNRALGLAPRKVRLDRVSHAGAGRDARVSADLAAEALARLAPTYDRLAERFGPAIPQGWARPGAGRNDGIRQEDRP